MRHHSTGLVTWIARIPPAAEGLFAGGGKIVISEITIRTD